MAAGKRTTTTTSSGSGDSDGSGNGNRLVATTSASTSDEPSTEDEPSAAIGSSDTNSNPSSAADAVPDGEQNNDIVMAKHETGIDSMLAIGGIVADYEEHPYAYDDDRYDDDWVAEALALEALDENDDDDFVG